MLVDTSLQQATAVPLLAAGDALQQDTMGPYRVSEGWNIEVWRQFLCCKLASNTSNWRINVSAVR